MDPDTEYLLPMFPLERVVMPSGIIPLRIFEDRYKEMFTFLDYDGAEFGTVLIEAGSEVGGGDRRFAVGSVVEIVERDFSQDLWQLVGIARSRVKVLEWIDTEAYPLARVSPMTLGESSAGTDETSEETSSQFNFGEVESIFRTVARLSSARFRGGWDPEIALPSDNYEAMMVMAESLPLSTLDKYKVLSAETEVEVADELLKAFEALLEIMGGSEGR